tara:strand:- start:3859 stop:4185 length:327 start_codon:yes stop_codon:yes gene_type:complete
MFKTSEDRWRDRSLRLAFGDDIGYDAAKNALKQRYGVGKIVKGPSNPSVRIPDGKTTEIATPIQSIPTAYAEETVMPAYLTADTRENTEAAQKAQAVLRQYLSTMKDR